MVAESSRLSDKLGDPTMPTAGERREHDKQHLPFRLCVRGKGKEAPHGDNKKRRSSLSSTWTSCPGGTGALPRRWRSW